MQFISERQRESLGALAVRFQTLGVAAVIAALAFLLLTAGAVLWLQPVLGLRNALLCVGGVLALAALVIVLVENSWERSRRRRGDQAGAAKPPSGATHGRTPSTLLEHHDVSPDAVGVVSAISSAVLAGQARRAPMATLAGVIAVGVLVAAIERKRTTARRAADAGHDHTRASKARQRR